MKTHLYLFLLPILFISSGCKHDDIHNYDKDHSLTIYPARTKSDNGVHAEDGSIVYTIGSVFQGGGIVDPSKGSSHQCHFYKDKYTTGPKLNEVEALVEISGFHHIGVEYTKPGQIIDMILINGLDETLGLGTNLIIPMHQGKYEGGNELIQDVLIQSYKLATFINKNGEQNKDADIRILITSKAGDVIIIRFMNDVTPSDGYE